MVQERQVRGVLLALSGEDADLLRALDAPGSGMVVVRRCADTAELLSAALAGLAGLVVVDTGFDELDRTVLDRLEHAGASGILLAAPEEAARWASAGWAIEDPAADPALVRARLQQVARRLEASAMRETGAPGGHGGAGTSGHPGARTGASPGQALDGSAGGGAVPSAGARPPAARSPEPTVPQARATDGMGDDDLWAEFEAGQAKAPPPHPYESPLPEAVAGTAGTPRPGAGPGAAPGSSPGTPGASVVTGREAPRSSPGASAPAASSRDGGPADESRAGKLLVVWGPHGSPGRSTVAASLARGLAACGGAILVDADVEAPCLTQLLGLPEDSSALATAARLASRGRLDAEALGQVLVPVTPNQWLLSGLGRPGRWRELPPAAMTDVWQRCREAAGWTVVDVAGGAIDDSVDDYTLEPGRGAVAAELVRVADVVVLVGAADPVSVRRLLQLSSDLEEDVKPSGRVEVVVNRVRSGVAGPVPQRAVRDALARFGGMNDVVVLPEDSSTADQCLMEGRAVLEAAPASHLGRALAGLVDLVDPAAGAGEAAALAAGPRGLRRLVEIGRRVLPDGFGAGGDGQQDQESTPDDVVDAVRALSGARSASTPLAGVPLVETQATPGAVAQAPTAPSRSVPSTTPSQTGGGAPGLAAGSGGRRGTGRPGQEPFVAGALGGASTPTDAPGRVRPGAGSAPPPPYGASAGAGGVGRSPGGLPGPGVIPPPGVPGTLGPVPGAVSGAGPVRGAGPVPGPEAGPGAGVGPVPGAGPERWVSAPPVGDGASGRAGAGMKSPPGLITPAGVPGALGSSPPDVPGLRSVQGSQGAGRAGTGGVSEIMTPTDVPGRSGSSGSASPGADTPPGGRTPVLRVVPGGSGSGAGRSGSDTGRSGSGASGHTAVMTPTDVPGVPRMVQTGLPRSIRPGSGASAATSSPPPPPPPSPPTSPSSPSSPSFLLSSELSSESRGRHSSSEQPETDSRRRRRGRHRA